MKSNKYNYSFPLADKSALVGALLAFPVVVLSIDFSESMPGHTSRAGAAQLMSISPANGHNNVVESEAVFDFINTGVYFSSSIAFGIHQVNGEQIVEPGTLKGSLALNYYPDFALLSPIESLSTHLEYFTSYGSLSEEISTSILVQFGEHRSISSSVLFGATAGSDYFSSTNSDHEITGESGAYSVEGTIEYNVNYAPTEHFSVSAFHTSSHSDITAEIALSEVAVLSIGQSTAEGISSKNINLGLQHTSVIGRDIVILIDQSTDGSSLSFDYSTPSLSWFDFLVGISVELDLLDTNYSEFSLRVNAEF